MQKLEHVEWSTLRRLMESKSRAAIPLVIVMFVLIHLEKLVNNPSHLSKKVGISSNFEDFLFYDHEEFKNEEKVTELVIKYLRYRNKTANRYSIDDFSENLSESFYALEKKLNQLMQLQQFREAIQVIDEWLKSLESFSATEDMGNAMLVFLAEAERLKSTVYKHVPESHWQVADPEYYYFLAAKHLMTASITNGFSSINKDEEAIEIADLLAKAGYPEQAADVLKSQHSS